MTRMFECASCDPCCYLVTDEDEVYTPGGCPWPEISNAPRWRDVGAVRLIELAFSGEMAAAVLDGRKCCTTRRTRHGDRGDKFDVAGVGFQIVQVLPATLSDVRDALYEAEGFATPQAFEETWRALHGGAFEADREVWVHFFARLPEDD